MMPSSSRCIKTSRTVVRLMPSCMASSRSDGSSSPGAMSPERIASRIWPTAAAARSTLGIAANPAMSGQPEVLGSVAPEELVMLGVVEPGQRVAEDLARPPPALGMRVVGGEHEQLWSALLDKPGGVLERERREPHLAADVLRRLELELLQQRLELRERSVGVIEVSEHPWDPTRAQLDGRASQLRVTVEDAVENEARKKPLR